MINDSMMQTKGYITMSKYKYWSTEKLEKLLKEMNWRIANTSYGMSDIYFRDTIENIIIGRENR